MEASDEVAGSPSARRGRRPWDWRRMRWPAAIVALIVIGVAAFAADVPLRRVVAETILTSQHYALARFVATPQEISAWRQTWASTPDVAVVTPAPAADPSATAVLSVAPVSGATFHGWLMVVPDPRRVIVGTSDDLGAYGEQTSHMAARLGAVAAINGGGFADPGGEGYGGSPIGLTLSEGRVAPSAPDDGSDYVIGFDLQDRLVAGKWDQATASTLGIRDAVTFKPLLVVDGRGQITSGDGGWGVAPRTVIGQRADGAVLLLVIDGRQPSSIGATLREAQNIMLGAGAVTAANLDGGASTVLWQDGQVVNHPSSPYGERALPTAFLVMPAGFDADAVARPNLTAGAVLPTAHGPAAPPASEACQLGSAAASTAAASNPYAWVPSTSCP